MADQKPFDDGDEGEKLAKAGEVPGQQRILGESGPGVSQSGMPAGQNRRESARMVEPGDGLGRTQGQSEAVMAISSATAPKSISTMESTQNVGSETGPTAGQRGAATAPDQDAGEKSK